jgi:hypothetical protein
MDCVEAGSILARPHRAIKRRQRRRRIHTGLCTVISQGVRAQKKVIVSIGAQLFHRTCTGFPQPQEFSGAHEKVDAFHTAH